VPNRRQGDSEEGIRCDFPIYLSPEDRAHLRIVVGYRGQLIDFALMQEVLFAGAWVDVVRYDCHRSFHVHRFTRRGQESERNWATWTTSMAIRPGSGRDARRLEGEPAEVSQWQGLQLPIDWRSQDRFC
jgi:hypothetical protein